MDELNAKYGTSFSKDVFAQYVNSLAEYIDRNQLTPRDVEEGRRRLVTIFGAYRSLIVYYEWGFSKLQEFFTDLGKLIRNSVSEFPNAELFFYFCKIHA